MCCNEVDYSGHKKASNLTYLLPAKVVNIMVRNTLEGSYSSTWLTRKHFKAYYFHFVTYILFFG